ncbi:hypothetical protein [Ferrovibrio sp.]|uniref:hypothetical protein n=1 Tax=Ferrovibrio sp. TaxID=1917215 RepID=UPI002625B35C|nr:hypothetical protein [Ferrovibrio sp.]
MRDICLILLAAIIASLPFLVLGNQIHRPARLADDSSTIRQQFQARSGQPHMPAGIAPVVVAR